MSNKTLSLVALACALVSGCATMEPEVATWNIPAPGANWQISQRNTGSFGPDRIMQTTRGPDGVWQGQPVVTLNSSAGFTIMATKEGLWHAIVAHDGKPITTYDPPIGFVYPMKVGKAWATHHRMTNVATGRVVEFDYSCKVEAFEKVTVPAGTFDTFRVACNSPGSTDVMWSSVDLGMWIKTDMRRNAQHVMGPGTQLQELVSLKR